MQLRKLCCPVLLLLLFVVTAKADSITLNVISWNFNSTIRAPSADLAAFNIFAVDSTGRIFKINYTNNFISIGSDLLNGNYVAMITTLAPSAGTTEINAITNAGAANGQVNYAVNVTQPTVTGNNGHFTGIPATLTGGIAITGNQSLSFNLMNGFASLNYFAAGVLVGIGIAGRDGTVTFNTPNANVPEPTSLLLLGSGLAALGLKARRRKQ